MAQYIIPAVALIVVATIEAIAAKDRKNVREVNASVEQRAEIRAEESRLAMQMMNASLELGFALALALEQHKLNGEMLSAKTMAKEAQMKYQAFLQKITAGEIAKS